MRRCCTSTCPHKALTPPSDCGDPLPSTSPISTSFCPITPTGSFQNLFHHLAAASSATSRASVSPALLLPPGGVGWCPLPGIFFSHSTLAKAAELEGC